MPIEVNCPGCSARLRVADEHAGKRARCPKCNTIYAVPGDSAAVPPEAPAASSPAQPAQPAEKQPAAWWMQTPEGHRYGPVPRSTLEQWLAEGRINHECHLQQEGSSWIPAADLFPQLLSEHPASSSRSTSASSSTSSGYANAYAPPSAAASGYRREHRGALLLVLALVGWMMGCPVFSVIAWLMAGNDLREMDTGMMDPSGRGLTQAAYYIGLIHVILLGLGFALGLAALIFQIAFHF